jgi:uncharacterized protein (TIGR02588 family)
MNSTESTSLEPEDLQQDTADEPPQKRTTAEWVTTIISTLIVTVVLGLLGYSWATQSDDPPLLAVSRKPPVRQADGTYAVHFTVKNLGGETVESVKILSEFQRNGEVESSGDLDIDFLSHNEEEEGAFILPGDPRTGKISIRVVSYKMP